MERAIVKGIEEEESILFVLRENDKKVFKKIPFNCYFYINYSDYEDFKNLNLNFFIKNVEHVQKNNGEFIKIILKNNFYRNKLKIKIEENNIKTYESDINAVKRFYIDNQNIPFNQEKLKYVFIDIETFDLTPLEKDFKQNVIAIEPILSFAIKDLNGRIEFHQNKAIEEINKELLNSYIKEPKNKIIISKIRELLIKNEKELLQKYHNIIKDYDVVFAWNGNKFDFPFIKQRMDKHKLNYNNLFTNDLDYMEIFKKNTWESLKSYSLNNVAKHIFKDEIEKNKDNNKLDELTKIDWKEKTGLKRFFDLYLFRNEIFKEYNIQDVNIMEMIENRLKFIKIHEIISKISHCQINNTVWNSQACDYLMLNKYKEKNIIANSKPNKEEIEIRKNPIEGSFIGGGFTRCFLPGLHKNVDAYDFKSMYPCHIITFNISTETFVKNVKPDLSLCFNKQEIDFIERVNLISKNFLDKKGELKINNYNKEIEIIKNSINKNLRSMKELMWHFVNNYNNIYLLNYCKDNEYIMTPADINFDTRGWKIHPHRLFKKNKGVLPELSQYLLSERDKVKYQLKNIEFHSGEWWSKEFYQLAIKVVGNSLYGYTSFKNSREFSYDIPDSITTASRATIKKSIMFAKKMGFDSVLCDTDSTYLKNVNDIKTLEFKYYEYFENYALQHNCSNKILLKNPENDKIEERNHFLVLEHEKHFETILAIKKKKYYFKYLKNDKPIYGTQGGMWKKTSVIKIAQNLQKELTTDILDENYNKEKWKNKILELKKKVFNFELELEHIIKVATISRPIHEYGKPVLDRKTGKQKFRKTDGEPMFAPIPSHIEVAKRLIKQNIDLNVGDKVEYIIKNTNPKQKAISVDEYKKDKIYDAQYYWDSIISPILEVFKVIEKENIYTYFGECWGYKENKINKLKKDIKQFELKEVYNEE